MMKSLLFGFLAFLAFQNVQSFGNHHHPFGPPPPPPPPTFKPEYINAIRERLSLKKLQDQVDVICPGYGENTENVTKSIQDCVNDIDLDTETLCSTVKNNAVECLQPGVELFEKCLPKESNGIPSFVVRLLLAVADYFCKTDGEHLLELHNKCVLTSTYKFERCVRKVATFRRQITQHRRNLSVDNVCELMTSLKSCMTSHLNLNCGHPITRAAVTDLMDKAMSACPRSEVASNEVELVRPNEE